MNMTALYVYSPTTFRTNRNIEPMVGAPHSPGEVQLQPGIYRISGDASVEAMNDPTASKHKLVTFDTKGGTPDPPNEAMQLHSSPDDIRNFFSSLGADDEIS